tara:strand:+ start:7947 stop:8585 length:639 start_codon:yes stop_codon:yes gene_type:complete
MITLIYIIGINSFILNNIPGILSPKKNINNIKNNYNNSKYNSFDEYIAIKKFTSEFYKNKDKIQDNTKNNDKQTKNVKLLTSQHVKDYAACWLSDMNIDSINNNKILYDNLQKMTEFSRLNRSEFYYYIGYYDNSIMYNYEPYYIGVFELLPSKKIFDTYIIIKNPTLIENNDKCILDYKHDILKLCYDSNIKLSFNNLINYNKKYYFSWLI